MQEPIDPLEHRLAISASRLRSGMVVVELTHFSPGSRRVWSEWIMSGIWEGGGDATLLRWMHEGLQDVLHRQDPPW